MKILVTGSNGFIGKHMALRLTREGHIVFPFDIDNTDEELVDYINQADFIIHLAGINRPLKTEDFYEGNSGFTSKLVELVKRANKNTPILISSSIQAEQDDDYGKSKRLAESYLFNSGLPVYIYRLSNAFGKWCKPNYNSACATFCYNIAHDLPIFVRDRDYVVHYNYIDDICDEFVKCINGDLKGSRDVLGVQPIHDCSLGKLSDLLYYFKTEIESDRHLPIIHSEFELKLFKTFCNYLSEINQLNYSKDDRGSFEELYKSSKWGQISENIGLPGIPKGGHYHTYKKEIFYTVIGECEIKQRNIQNNVLKVDVVKGTEPRFVKIIPMHTHQIANIGSGNSHTLMWISEIFNQDSPDSYLEKV